MEQIAEQLSRIETLLRTKISDVLSVKEVAVLINKSESRIRHMVSERSIPHYRNDLGQISFRKSDIEEWRLGQRIPTMNEIEQQAVTYTAINKQ